MSYKHLYIIGNGFDRYHGADSDYLSFRKFFLKMKEVLPENATWKFSYHSGRDEMQIKRFCKKMKIKEAQTKRFEL